jgi:hypothetical protein
MKAKVRIYEAVEKRNQIKNRVNVFCFISSYLLQFEDSFRPLHIPWRSGTLWFCFEGTRAIGKNFLPLSPRLGTA